MITAVCLIFPLEKGIYISLSHISPRGLPISEEILLWCCDHSDLLIIDNSLFQFVVEFKV